MLRPSILLDRHLTETQSSVIGYEMLVFL